MNRLWTRVVCLVTLCTITGRCKPLNTQQWQDITAIEWLMKKGHECPASDNRQEGSAGDAREFNKNIAEGDPRDYRENLVQYGNASALVVLQRTILMLRLDQLLMGGPICDKMVMSEISTAIEPLHRQVLASGHVGTADNPDEAGYFGEVSDTWKKLNKKVHSLKDYLEVSGILGNLQSMRLHLQTLQHAADLGLIREYELDDILDEIKDWLDSVGDVVDKVLDYLEHVEDSIRDWIKDMPLEDLEKLFEFLHFWYHNVEIVEINCDGTGVIRICDVEYVIGDIIVQCCIMG